MISPSGPIKFSRGSFYVVL
uniref:Uncharacterized protein n=1 Tax=Arundo donax TaxID=35708 RepID=A0A0A8Z656_ARUDO